MKHMNILSNIVHYKMQQNNKNISKNKKRFTNNEKCDIVFVYTKHIFISKCVNAAWTSYLTFQESYAFKIKKQEGPEEIKKLKSPSFVKKEGGIKGTLHGEKWKYINEENHFYGR